MSTEPNAASPIAWLIRACAGRAALVIWIAIALAVLGVWSARRARSTRCRISRHAGRHRDRVDGSQPHAHRGPSHVSHRHRVFGCAEGQDRARFHHVRDELRLCRLRRRTDLYWARSRVALEQLAKVQSRLPAGVTAQIGPDATSVGWVYQYALVDDSGQHDLQELRSFPGLVAAVLAPGRRGRVRGRDCRRIREAIPNSGRSCAHEGAKGSRSGGRCGGGRGANTEVGGRVIEMAQHEYVLRGRGYVERKEDLESAVVATDSRGTPIRIRDVGRCRHWRKHSPRTRRSRWSWRSRWWHRGDALR